MPLKPIKTNPRIEVIKNDPEKATMYAIYVLKRRWPEAEPVIKQDRITYDYYRDFFKIK